MKKEKLTLILSLGILALVVLMVYGNTLKAGFIYDDDTLVKNNVFIKKWSYLPEVFTEDIGGGKSSFYRPLQMVTYMADYSLWGLYPQGYHLTSIILHVFCVLAVYWLVSVLFPGRGALSFFTALLFGVHPAHAEVVSYVSGRSDSLGLLFLVMSLVFYIKGVKKENIVSGVSGVMCFVAALLSRENSLILPFIILLYHYSFGEKIRVKQFAPIALVSILYIFVRVTFLAPLLSKAVHETTLAQRLPGFFAAVTGYIKILVFPSGLHMEYGRKLFSYVDAPVLAGGIILVSAIAAALMFSKKNKLIFFSISWIIITILPVSNLYPINAYMAEHWLYLPSVGFFLMAAYFLARLYEKKNMRIAAMIITAAVSVFYARVTMAQNAGYWNNPEEFYRKTLEYSQDNPTIYNNLANMYMGKGEEEKAIAAYKKAIELEPSNFLVYANLGVIYTRLGRTAEAEKLYLEAIKNDPKNANAYNNLGNIYKDSGNYKAAISAYERARGIEPRDPGIYYNLGTAYRKSADTAKAIAFYEKAIQLDPAFAVAYINLSLCYFDLKEYDKAAGYADLARRYGYPVDPKYLEALVSRRK